jgi:5-methylcytosine-specific restriction endonuclease McrA
VSRAVPEWIGKTPDSPIPDRVKLRVCDRAEGKCKKCEQPARPAQFDHAIPLILGGENRESNLQLLCVPCHKAKTALDVRIKAKVARVRKRHLGIAASRQKIKSHGFPKRPPQRNASRPVEKWRGF